jgi:hypothetical protein
MKKLLTAFTISAYLGPVAIVAGLLLAYLFSEKMLDAPDSAFTIAYILVVLPLLLSLLLSWALSLASMLGALRAAKTGQPLPFQTVLRCKLRLLPFYLLDFVFFTMFGLMTMGPWGMMLVPLACGHIWWVMAGVSAHGIAKLSVLRRQNRITKGQCALHCLLQLIFALDLIDAIYLAKREKQPAGEPRPL